MSCSSQHSLVLHFLVAVAVLVCGVWNTEAADVDLSDRLVEFGLAIEAQIESAQHNLERGNTDRDALVLQAVEAERVLEGLERRLNRLPDGPSESLVRKFESIRSQVANLRRAAELGSAPPRLVPTDGRIVDSASSGGHRAAPTNDNCENAIPVGMGAYLGDTSEATNDGEAICGASLVTPDVWYRFVAPAYGLYVIETAGSSYDTVLSVHTDCPGTMDNQVACNDDYSGLQSMVAVSLYASYEYLIRVSGANGATGAHQLTISQGGAIGGSVTTVGTGLPVNTRVEVFDADSYLLRYDYTDSVGNYEVTSMASGTYYVATDDSPSTINQIYDGVPCPGGVPSGCVATDGDPVSVTVGYTTSGIDFVLESGGVVTGIVTDEQTGLPIEDARVRFYSENGYSVAYTYTDVLGVFSYENLNSGTFYVVVESSSFRDELFDDIPCPGGPSYGCSLQDGTPVTVEIGSTTTGIDFTLVPLGAIEGSIVDRLTGLPVSYADAVVHDSDGAMVAVADVDSSGNYAAGGLENGTYYVAAHRSYSYVSQVFDGINCPASGCDVLDGDPVVVDNHATVSGIDFDLVPKGKITGHVVDVATSLPVSSVRVRVYSDTGSSVDYDYTDSSGSFDVDRLFSGTYYVATDDSRYVNQLYDGIPCPSGCSDPTSGTPVTVADGTTSAGIDFSLVARGEITGTVTAEDGGGFVNMRMELYDDTGGYVDYEYSYNGEYRFSGLADGEYYVVADQYWSSYAYLGELYDNVPCWGGYPGGCDLLDGTVVIASTGTATSGIDFSLKKMATISGLVRDASDLSAVSGSVYARSVDGTHETSDGLSNGAYSINWLVPGDYLLVADSYAHRDEVWQDVPCAGEYPDDCDVSPGTPISVSAGDEVVVDMLLDRLGSIEGEVLSAEDGSPVTSTYVRLFAADGDELASDYTNSSGAYAFNGVWPGSIYIGTDGYYSQFVDQLYDGIACPGGPPTGCDPTTGTPVIVNLGGTTQIDFDLDRTSSISGRVTDARTGLPLYGVNVGVWDSSGAYRYSDSTDVSGAYEVGGLEAGTFYVASDEYSTYSLTYIDELYDGIPCPTGPPDGCDPTKGTPVEVLQGQSTRFIDLSLEGRSSGIAGMVTGHQTGAPIDGIQIDIWNTSTGGYTAGAVTTTAGTFVAEVDEGSYVVATDNPGSWANEIWDGIPCVDGSAYNGDCDPMTGNVVHVIADGLTEQIDFVLVEANLMIFADGFESSSTSGWSSHVP